MDRTQMNRQTEHAVVKLTQLHRDFLNYPANDFTEEELIFMSQPSFKKIILKKQIEAINSILLAW